MILDAVDMNSGRGSDQHLQTRLDERPVHQYRGSWRLEAGDRLDSGDLIILAIAKLDYRELLQICGE